MLMIERNALIFNIQKYNMYDGPGVRTLIFFKGCPMRCKWCSNPEGQLRRPQILHKKDLCVLCGTCVSNCPAGVHLFSHDKREHRLDPAAHCTGCGKCAQLCPASALALVGEEKSISELFAVIEEDRPFYDMSGGGVTLGGGEVLAQAEAAANLLLLCKEKGIHTAMETGGYAKPDLLLHVAEFVDLHLFDLKLMDSARHYALTGVHNESILGNLRLLLEKRHAVRIRMPLLKGLNDREEDIAEAARFLQPYQEYKNFTGIDLLPYHKLGVHKYAQLGLEYPLSGDFGLSAADIERIAGSVRSYGLPVAVVQH
jgi:pyruvate formate lyase activating enzyme